MCAMASRTQGLKTAAELTDEEKKTARNVWNKHVEGSFQDCGIAFFKELFRRFPEYEFFFVKMLKQNEDIFKNAKFNQTVKKILTKIKESLEMLDQPTKLQETMKPLGKFHTNIMVNRRHIDLLHTVIMDTLRSRLGKTLTAGEDQALSKCLKVVFDLLSEAIEAK